jgi:hypothetical protein
MYAALATAVAGLFGKAFDAWNAWRALKNTPVMQKNAEAVNEVKRTDEEIETVAKAEKTGNLEELQREARE